MGCGLGGFVELTGIALCRVGAVGPGVVAPAVHGGVGVVSLTGVFRGFARLT